MEKETPTPFSYHPPPGGDVTLKSADSIVFVAHSALLGMASPVLADMMSSVTQKDVLELSDDSESISLMLRFIYPPTFLEDLPIEQLEKSLCMAQKYQVNGIITSIDHLPMLSPVKSTAFICTHPVRTFCLALTYGLRQTREAAMMTLHPERFKFQKSEEIKQLADAFPSAATAIGLLGAHCVRTQALLDLLFGHRLEVFLPAVTSSRMFADIMMCRECFIEMEYSLEEGASYKPGWIGCWLTLTFDRITSQSLDQSRGIFDDEALHLIDSRPDVCEDCVEAARVACKGRAFKQWAMHILLEVEKIFEDIEPLYDL